MFNRSFIKEQSKLKMRERLGIAILVLLITVILGGQAASITVSLHSSFNSVKHFLSTDSSAYSWTLGPIFSLGGFGMLYSVFVGNIIGLGARGWFLRYQRGENPDIGELFASFRIYIPALGTTFLRGLYTWLWSLLFVIPGIVKHYAYSMSDYIIYENPNITASQALSISCRMTDGAKGDLFVFDLSYLGWQILNAFTVGILGIVYVNPYIYTAHAGIYDSLKITAIHSGRLTWADFGQIPPDPTAYTPETTQL